MHPLVTSSRGSKYRGFVTLVKAKAYMEDEGVEKYDYKIIKGTGITALEKGRMAYYVVANGRQPGIYENY